MNFVMNRGNIVMKKVLCLLSFRPLLACCKPFDNGFSFSRAEDLIKVNESGQDSSKKGEKILSLSNKEPFFNSSTFNLTFSIASDVDTSFEENGCVVLDLVQNQEHLVVKIRVLEDNAFLIIRLKSGESSFEKKVYFYRNAKGSVYYSLLSLDSAKKLSGIDPSSLYSGIGGFPIGGGTISGPIQRAKTFRCSLSWKDSHKTEFPLVGAKVYLKTQSGKSLWKVTDSSGIANFNFVKDDSLVGGGKDYLSSMWTEISNNEYSLSLSLSNSFINVTDSKGQDYDAFLPNQLVTGTSSKDFSYSFEPFGDNSFGSDFGQAVQIYQALYYYSKHAYELVGQNNSIKPCKVVFPTEGSGDWYNNQTIYIGNDSENNISGFSYESWDAIGHEYGHHLEYLFDISHSKGGRHYINQDNSPIMECEPSLYAVKRDYNLRLAWAEAWATIWAAIAQKSFPDQLQDATYLSIGDDKYTASNFNYDASGNTFFYLYNSAKDDLGVVDYDEQIDKGNSGDGCELSIERFLYQLFDDDNDEIDRYTIPEKKLWDFTLAVSKQYKLNALEKEQYEGKSADMYTLNYFYQFLSALEAKFGFDGIAKLAERYSLCPSYPFLKCENGNYKVYWDENLPLAKFKRFRYNALKLKLYSGSNDQNPIILTGTEPVLGKAMEISGKNYSYYQLDSSEATKIVSAGSQAYLSVEQYYIPSTKYNYEYLGPVEGPKTKV